MQTEVMDDQALSNPSTPTDKTKTVEKLVNYFCYKFYFKNPEIQRLRH